MRKPTTRARMWDLLRRAQGVARLERALSGLAETVEGTHARVAEIEARLERLDNLVSEDLSVILRSIAAEDAENRRRLWRARSEPDYELPFTDPEPLVSVIIPTFDRPSLLVERSLSSVLAQSYERLEVIVVGDHASADVADAVASLRDPRIRFHNLSQRLPRETDPRKSWAIGSVLARNEGIRLATGLWLKHFDDDDFLRPHAIEILLEAARESHAEVVYGRFRWIRDGDEGVDSGEFPPREGAFNFQTSVVHRALRFFERELVAGAFGKPSDAFSVESMLRAGVRFHMIPSVVCDYHDSGRATAA